MLRKINDLRGFELYAVDGDIGAVTEFYFDDLDWTILYMVIDSGAWLPGRRVLVSPAALGGEADWVERKMSLMVTRGEIEKARRLICISRLRASRKSPISRISAGRVYGAANCAALRR